MDRTQVFGCLALALTGICIVSQYSKIRQIRLVTQTADHSQIQHNPLADTGFNRTRVFDCLDRYIILRESDSNKKKIKKFSALPDKYLQGDIIQVPINQGFIWDLVDIVDIWDLHSHLYMSRENSLANGGMEVLHLLLRLLASSRYHICNHPDCYRG